METKIKTYKKRPECECPECKLDGYILLANKWICGEHYLKWYKIQMKKEHEAATAIFKEMMEEEQNETKD